jgi:hypothetical protein
MLISQNLGADAGFYVWGETHILYLSGIGQHPARQSFLEAHDNWLLYDLHGFKEICLI